MNNFTSAATSGLLAVLCYGPAATATMQFNAVPFTDGYQNSTVHLLSDDGTKVIAFSGELQTSRGSVYRYVSHNAPVWIDNHANPADNAPPQEVLTTAYAMTDDGSFLVGGRINSSYYRWSQNTRYDFFEDITES